MNRIASPPHSFGVTGTAAEDQVILRKIEVLNRERIEHEVLPEPPLNAGQILHRRSANVSGPQALRQTMRQCYGRVDRRGGKRIVHGDGHALSSAHLNKVVMNECDLRHGGPTFLILSGN